jgi:hypothetical protein
MPTATSILVLETPSMPVFMASHILCKASKAFQLLISIIAFTTKVVSIIVYLKGVFSKIPSILIAAGPTESFSRK